ncbi:hypothetical protein QBC34DRAFT_444427 [Podospora aff. communis PSN243]|uniref:Mid2 domain-containing protein n=1 Tax=Podospora aff. communis PSN243 TaxID=3040156 RepID=A0AAV9FZU4_9PEZI|nr:hypothetical protein QBC34DRAFT_444427 [Podospora aff. communis PSN243]
MTTVTLQATTSSFPDGVTAAGASASTSTVQGTTVTLENNWTGIFSTTDVLPTNRASGEGSNGRERTQLQSNDQADGSGLSTAAKAGIGVGIGIFVILMAALVFLFTRRRRRKGNERHGAVAPQPNMHERRMELHTHEHSPAEAPSREYIWGPGIGKQQGVEMMPPEPMYELETPGFQGLRPPPSPGRVKVVENG